MLNHYIADRLSELARELGKKHKDVISPILSLRLELELAQNFAFLEKGPATVISTSGIVGMQLSAFCSPLARWLSKQIGRRCMVIGGYVRCRIDGDVAKVQLPDFLVRFDSEFSSGLYPDLDEFYDPREDVERREEETAIWREYGEVRKRREWETRYDVRTLYEDRILWDDTCYWTPYFIINYGKHPGFKWFRR